MNSDYRRGYRDGLELANAYAQLGMKMMDAGGIKRYAREYYGTRNSVPNNSRKAGFRDGYTTGMEAAQIERGRVSVRTRSDTETGGNSE